VSGPARPGRTTVLVGLLLALLLVVAYAVTSWSTAAPQPPVPQPPAPPAPATTPVPPPGTPQQGAGYPVRRVGALQSDRSVLVNGRGNADLRYRRAPHNGTRLHFICTGCDAGTWLVEQPRGAPVGGGALADPADVTSAIDTVRPRGTSSLLVEAPPTARWTATLTPFDAVPVHEQTFDALGDDVVAVRARADLEIRCGGAALVRTLAREAGAQEYTVVRVRREQGPGSWALPAPSGSDLMVVVVSCPGRWTLTLP
jgi:hypothetical protein